MQLHSFDSSVSSDNGLPTADERHRAIHRIRLDAISHNYSCVESAANRQRCSVIVVVKADGYGHGAIATALHLADYCGADAFAVATLQEGIELRKAFNNTKPGQTVRGTISSATITRTGSASDAYNNANSLLSLLVSPPTDNGNGTKSTYSVTATDATSTSDYAGNDRCPSPTGSVATWATNSTSNSTANLSWQIPTNFTLSSARVMRPSKIRILVLGPPVGFPRCFDDYHHYEVEAMVSGPEVAAALLEWVKDSKERKRLQVEKIANETKAKALTMTKKQMESKSNPTQNGHGHGNHGNAYNLNYNNEDDDFDHDRSITPIRASQFQSSTLGNVTGRDLANEVRMLLLNQKRAAEEAKASKEAAEADANANSHDVNSRDHSPVLSGQGGAQQPTGHGQVFGGIEAAAKSSRTREKAAQRATGVFVEDSKDDKYDVSASKQQTTASSQQKFLRWHALVDTGMGRLGFKTKPITKEEATVGQKRDTVEIIQELVDMEMQPGSPLEFYGMCTHMADSSNSSSSYTQEQIDRFKSLLKRVRAAGISVPTVSTDNSAALLSTNLNHFDPKEILSQDGQLGTPTRGYVRTGGAIFGQRPTFKQLKSVSTLLASVRHVAILKKGESVGYDRAYIAPFDVRIATLTIGFADGLPRELGNGVGKVEIRKQVFPIAGNVCMDMVMVELGPTSKNTEVKVGDTAVIWGPSSAHECEDGGPEDFFMNGCMNNNNGNGLVPLQEIASKLKTTQSALTCGLDKVRVLRQFV